MKLTKTGYRISKNGNVIKGFEDGSLLRSKYHGETVKVFGTYYFFNRKQGDTFVYLS